MFGVQNQLLLCELGLDTSPSDEVAAFASVTTADILRRYIIWIFKLMSNYSWEKMFAFDKQLGDRLAREKTGSLYPSLLIHEFLTDRISTEGETPIWDQNKNKRTSTCHKLNSARGCKEMIVSSATSVVQPHTVNIIVRRIKDLSALKCT